MNTNSYVAGNVAAQPYTCTRLPAWLVILQPSPIPAHDFLRSWLYCSPAQYPYTPAWLVILQPYYLHTTSCVAGNIAALLPAHDFLHACSGVKHMHCSRSRPLNKRPFVGSDRCGFIPALDELAAETDVGCTIDIVEGVNTLP